MNPHRLANESYAIWSEYSSERRHNNVILSV